MLAKIVALSILFISSTLQTTVLIESDILVNLNEYGISINQTVDQLKTRINGHHYQQQQQSPQRPKRAATSRKERIWDFGVVPFVIDPIFSGDEKAGFKQAMKHWENHTCIKFVERNASEHKDFIRFTESRCGCCSHVGRQGNGAQNVSIGKNCHKIGVIVHELGHAIGFWHEHTRPDRDQYVDIIDKNIENGHEHNFDKLSAKEVDSLGEPYDHNSIMHYARDTYSKNSFDVIVPKRGEAIGQRERLSKSDIIQANRLYRCAKCGRTFLDQQARFVAPNYDKNEIKASNGQRQRYECEWRILGTHGERIQLNITDLMIFKSNNCQSDYLEVRDGYYYKSPLLGRFCGTIQSPTVLSSSSSSIVASNNTLPIIISTGHRMVVTYVSEHFEYVGFAANYLAICGGDLTIENGHKIESPNYPQPYSAYKDCQWRITVPPRYQVALEFYSFDLEVHSQCRHDFIEVRDGIDAKARLIGRYCGNSLPPILASTSNRMFIRFVSDGSGVGRGFSAALFKEIDECKLFNHGCEQNCINTLDGYTCACRFGFKLGHNRKSCEVTCGGIIENTANGIIESPAFPHPYPANEECIWEIHTHEPNRIALSFVHFELEGSNLVQEECDYDSVTISSKYPNGQLKRHAIHCSELLPPSITSETNIMRIKFKSDKTVQKSGFSAKFYTVINQCANKNGGCQHECQTTQNSFKCSCKSGFVLHANGFDCVPGRCRYEIVKPQGEIRSENYPNKYPKNVDCLWHFKALQGHRPHLQFVTFDIEDDYECSNDYVSVYIDVDTTKRLFTNTETYTLGKFCGSRLPESIASPSNDLYMAFKSDSSVQRQGFIVNHSTVCGGHFVASKTIQYIASHARYGDTVYKANTTCDWILTTKPSRQFIYLEFIAFDVEAEKACSFDFLEVYEERQRHKWHLYGRYCGELKHLEIVSSGRIMLRFQTDDNNQNKGFSIAYSIANKTTITDYQNGSSRFSQPNNNYIDGDYLSTFPSRNGSQFY